MDRHAILRSWRRQRPVVGQSARVSETWTPSGDVHELDTGAGADEGNPSATRARPGSPRQRSGDAGRGDGAVEGRPERRTHGRRVMVTTCGDVDVAATAHGDVRFSSAIRTMSEIRPNA